ncbi:Rieske (2Fe-2S) protein [Cohnella panacarvi]|uniref:Rieske (2Fe-2S) protein n=1 Tax=Cohnella panacarvi TaxID=400776 RepID=UPI00047E5801|nr:Rieske (2Fe-2S) protein [Cohnella panacarvi]
MSRHRVAGVDEIKAGERKLVKVNGMEFGIFNVGGQYHAYRNVCPHAGADVCVGTICGTLLPTPVYEYSYGRENEILRCPWHGWEFDLKTGEHLVDPDMRLRSGKLESISDSSENLERGELETDEDGIFLIL